MAQSRVTSPLDIYNTLSADVEFMSCIGEYRFENNTAPSPSFSIVTPGLSIQGLKDVRGLEVVIHDVASVDRKDFLTDSSIALVTYQLYLILWKEGLGADMTAANVRITKLFSGARSILTVPINKTPNVSIQMVVEIPDNAAITN